jgi:hypothetical protein
MITSPVKIKLRKKVFLHHDRPHSQILQQIPCLSYSFTTPNLKTVVNDLVQDFNDNDLFSEEEAVKVSIDECSDLFCVDVKPQNSTIGSEIDPAVDLVENLVSALSWRGPVTVEHHPMQRDDSSKKICDILNFDLRHGFAS